VYQRILAQDSSLQMFFQSIKRVSWCHIRSVFAAILIVQPVSMLVCETRKARASLLGQE
jgi:hypothetical protein